MIWLTRPIEDSLILAQTFHRTGLSTVVEPVLQIQYEKNNPLRPAQVDAVIFTSRHSLISLQRREKKQWADLKKLPTFAVGKSTAHLAKQLGFKNCIVGDNGVDSLTEKVCATFSSGHLLYCRGETVSLELKPVLEEAGLTVTEHVMYRTKGVDHVTPYLQQLFVSHTIKGVVAFSRKSAEAIVCCIKNVNENVAAHLWILSISETVQSVCAALPWARNEVLSELDPGAWVQKAKDLTKLV